MIYIKYLIFCTSCISPFFAFAQNCIFFESEGYEGDTYNINLGESIEVVLADTILMDNPSDPNAPPDTILTSNQPSWKVLDASSAILIERITSHLNYPFQILYSVESSSKIQGNDSDSFSKSKVRVSCISKDSLPQPQVLIPLDGYESISFSKPPPMPDSDNNLNMLVLKKAFLWGNSEQLDCCHGPAGAVSIRTYPPTSFTPFASVDYNSEFISEQYCEGVITNCINCCNKFEKQMTDFRMPGPAFTFDNKCDEGADYVLCGEFVDDLGDFAQLVFDIATDPQGIKLCDLLDDCEDWLNHNPTSEWLDGPWGVRYSNFPLIVWDTTQLNDVFVMIREGDEGGFPFYDRDDYMGGRFVSKFEQGEILVRCYHFGWLVLENITLPPHSKEPSVDIANRYWFNAWDGVFPVDIIKNQEYDQYSPLPNATITEMEARFSEGDTVGLLGGRFPAGLLSKPMIYIASGMPAVFSEANNNFPIRPSFSKPRNEKPITITNEKLNSIISPNPTASQVQWPPEYGKTVTVLNANGQILLSRTETNQIDLSTLPQGIYFLQIRDDKGGIKYGKVMKK